MAEGKAIKKYKKKHRAVSSCFVLWAQRDDIVVESALVVMLLASAGLLIRSYINVESVDTGFSESTVSLNIGPDPRYSHPQAVEFFRSVFGRLRALPDVQTVGAVGSLPLSNSEDPRMFAVDAKISTRSVCVK